MIAVVEPQPLLAAHLAACIGASGGKVADLENAEFAVVFVDAPVAGWGDHLELVAAAGLQGVVITRLGDALPALAADLAPRTQTLARPFSPTQLREALVAIGALAPIESLAATVDDDGLLGVDEDDVIEEIEAVPAASSADVDPVEAAANEALAFATEDESMEMTVDESDVIDEVERVPAFSNPVVHEATMRLARTIAGEVELWSTFTGEERVRTVYGFLASYARGDN